MTRIDGGRHLLVHGFGLVAFDEVALVAVAGEKRFEFGVRDAREHGGTGDFVAVEMEDRENGAVARGVEEFVGVPGGGAGAGLGFAIADDAAGEEVGVVEDRAIGVDARHNRARRLR